jgi:hypothetical protein
MRRGRWSAGERMMLEKNDSVSGVCWAEVAKTLPRTSWACPPEDTLSSMKSPIEKRTDLVAFQGITCGRRVAQARWAFVNLSGLPSFPDDRVPFWGARPAIPGRVTPHRQGTTHDVAYPNDSLSSPRTYGTRQNIGGETEGGKT